MAQKNTLAKLRMFKKLIAWLGKNRKGQTQNPSTQLDSIATKRPEEIHFHWHFNDMAQSPTLVAWNILPTSMFESVTSVASVDLAKPIYDEHLLDSARTQWQFGDWESLAALSREEIEGHPERAKLALLAAAGHQQTGDMTQARQFVCLANEWGVDKKLVSQILIAGVHNSIGRAAAIANNQSRSAQHFESAIRLVSPGADVTLVSHVRSVREISNLGLLPQASRKIDQLHRHIKQSAFDPSSKHAKILDLEVDVLRDRIYSLQQQYAQFKINSPIIGRFTETKSNKASSSTYQGLHGLDKKLEIYLDYDNGYFVELGANDGTSQSNTYYFETQRHWRGLLIEPVLHNFLKCKASRSPENAYACAACVSFSYPETHVRLVYSNLMTTALDLETDIANPSVHAELGKAYLGNGETPVEILAPAKTLKALLDEANAPSVIDLLSLDVEGAEIEVLKGIDHQRYRFKYLLIESRSEEVITSFLAERGYRCIDKLSNHDYLYTDVKSEYSRNNII